MRVKYKWEGNTVVSEIQCIVSEPTLFLFSGTTKSRLTLQFYDGGELCLGECKEADSITEKALKDGYVDLTGYKFSW